jgi:retrograde regulation protein 2
MQEPVSPLLLRPAETVRFRSTAEHGKKLKIHLDIFVSEEAAKRVDLESIADLFNSVRKQKHEGKKVIVTINPPA